LTSGSRTRAAGRPTFARRFVALALAVGAGLAVRPAPSTASPLDGLSPSDSVAIHLRVPVVKQARERCGPAALRMVLGFYGAPDSALALADLAYDPALRGSLVTDLAARARQAGFAARVTRAEGDSAVRWLAAGQPPILLISSGVGLLSRGHYVVVTGFDPERGRYTIHDGGAKPRTLSVEQLHHESASAGRVALLVAPDAVMSRAP